MRRLLALAVLLLVALPVASAGAASAGTYKSCSGGYNPDGSAGRFYQYIRAKRVSCAEAKRTTHAWIIKEANSDGANPTGKIKVGAYTCSGTSTASAEDPDGGLRVLCVRDRNRKAVRFYGHP